MKRKETEEYVITLKDQSIMLWILNINLRVVEEPVVAEE
jgi:hypothetical protein